MAETKQGIYVHIPFCRSRCAYCGFVSSVGQYDMQAYLDALLSEIGERVRGAADSVYIGGGTPSVLPRGLLRVILNKIRACAQLAEDCEITVEANPDSCDREFLTEFLQSGGNRLSLGVQSLNDAVLRKIGRRHTSAQAREAVRLAKDCGLHNISCDLMLGLPGQTLQDVHSAVGAVCDWGVTHVSVYALAVEEGTQLYRDGYHVEDDAAADMYDEAYARLSSAGFLRYEVSNFCRVGFECRHNRKYWQRVPYVGVGVAAHSFDGARRVYNTSDIAGYVAGRRDEKGYTVNAREALEEYIMLGLRTHDGIDFSKIEELCGYDWQMRNGQVLEELTRDGFTERTETGIRLQDTAYYVMNEIIVRLLGDV